MPKAKTTDLTIPDSSNSIQPVGKFRGRDMYADNPFICASRGFCVQVRKDMTLVAKGLEIKDSGGDEVAAGVIGRVQLVDSEEFVKLYTRNVALIFEISPAAQKALIAVFVAVQQQAKDQAEIFLSYIHACQIYKQLGIEKIPSSGTFSRGMSQLLDIGFLAVSAKRDGWYWINPNLLFNGDRVRFVHEYRLKRKQELSEESSS